MEQIIPQSLEETILSYLRLQEVYPGEHDVLEAIDEEGSIISETSVKAILDDLLSKVNKRILCKDKYENIHSWHNQYPLFDLNDYIVDFCVDDEIFNKLAFKETLMVSELKGKSDERETEPKPIGGLCLDIQIAEGCIPKNKPTTTETELDQELYRILQSVKQAMDQKQTPDEIDDELHEKLVAYEAFLKNEMRNNVRKFVVHMASQFDCGESAGSSIMAWVDRNFHTLEEKRSEFIYLPDSEKSPRSSISFDTATRILEKQDIDEKSLYVGLQPQKYYIRATSGLQGQEERKYYSLNKTKEMICEGANFLLMRYLAITQYEGTVVLSTIYINGDMCKNVYECTGSQPGKVNDKTVDICKIYRYIIEECGIEHHCVTVLTTDGKIVTQEWEGCNYILNINPLQFIGSAKQDKLDLQKTWTDDLQLFSKFLDYKTETKMKMHNYMTDHREVREFIADYMQNVLFLKPENILSYTMEHFQSLYPSKIGAMVIFEDNSDEESFTHFDKQPQA